MLEDEATTAAKQKREQMRQIMCKKTNKQATERQRCLASWRTFAYFIDRDFIDAALFLSNWIMAMYLLAAANHINSKSSSPAIAWRCHRKSSRSVLPSPAHAHMPISLMYSHSRLGIDISCFVMVTNKIKWIQFVQIDSMCMLEISLLFRCCCFFGLPIVPSHLEFIRDPLQSFVMRERERERDSDGSVYARRTCIACVRVNRSVYTMYMQWMCASLRERVSLVSFFLRMSVLKFWERNSKQQQQWASNVISLRSNRIRHIPLHFPSIAFDKTENFEACVQLSSIKSPPQKNETKIKTEREFFFVILRWEI